MPRSTRAQFPDAFRWGCFHLRPADRRRPPTSMAAVPRSGTCSRQSRVGSETATRRRWPADHFHHLNEDLDLVKALGVDAYRFSVSWPRIMPTGTGAVNGAGLAFYDRLVDGLLERGVEPWLTLYHWDLPQPLEDAGGWPRRETALAFADFADVVSRRLGDRVKRWITHNEPWWQHDQGLLRGASSRPASATSQRPCRRPITCCCRMAWHCRCSDPMSPTPNAASP